MAPWSATSGGSSSRQPGWQLPFVEEGRTPVGIAAARGDLDALEECVQLQRMDPNEFDSYKETPLHLAVIYGRTEAVKLLVMDLGAKVDLPNWEGATPLCYAVAHGHLEIAKFLVKSKANINHSSQHGLRPLHFAAMYGSTEGVAWLLDRGANPMKTTQFMTVARDMTRPGPSRRMLHRAMDGLSSEMPSAR